MSAPKNILRIIASNKTSLGENPALPPENEEKFLISAVNRYYDEVASHFDAIDTEEIAEDLSKTVTECRRIEAKNREALEKLCSGIINEIFNIPEETIILDMNLTDRIDTRQERMVPESSDGYTFESIDEINSLTREIYKRRMLNVLTVGAAMHYAEDVDRYAGKLDAIDPRLKPLYRKIMCINNLLTFHISNGKNTDGGRVDVYLSGHGNRVVIKSYGILFPILLEETIKGILELSIAHGLPEEREKAEYITGKTDFKMAEIWDQRLGLPLWNQIASLMKSIGETPEETGINFMMMEMAQMKPEHFNSSMQEILAGTRSGGRILKKLCRTIAGEKENDEFNDYVHQMNGSTKNTINDEEGEFTPDDLINSDLCSGTILDEEY